MVDIGRRASVHGVRCVVGEEAEVLGATDRGRAHEADRLAGVDALHGRDLGGSTLDQISDRPQDLLTLGAGPADPVTERVARRAARRIDVGDIASGHLAKQRTVDRRVILERSAGHAGAWVRH